MDERKTGEAPRTMADAIAELGGHDKEACVRCRCIALNGPHPVAECCPPPSSAPWLPGQLQRMWDDGDRNGIVAEVAASINAAIAREDGTHTATGSVTGNGALD